MTECQAGGPVARKILLALIVLAFAAALQCVHAQPYPSRPIRLMAAGVGGGNDFVARLLADKLGDQIGQRFIVENRPGAGGIVATQQVAKAAPDGYMLLIGVAGPLAMLPHVEKVQYHPLKDFTGVSLLASSSTTCSRCTPRCRCDP